MPPGEAAAWFVCLTISRFFGIESLGVIESTLPRRHLRFVLAWAELHQDELRENWRRARAGETLQPIESLR
jgi:hypothetical protein